MTTKKDRGIVRIDQPEKYNHGWWVRRRRGEKTHSKFFTDKRYGGKRKALLAARSFNDNLTAILPPINRKRTAAARRAAAARAATARRTVTARKPATARKAAVRKTAPARKKTAARRAR